MLKSIKRSDSYLLESSSSNNSTSNIITTSTNNTQNSLLKRTTKPNVSSTRAPSFTFSRLLSEDAFNYNTNSNSNNTNIHNLIIIIASIPQFMASLLQAEEIIF